MQVPDWFAQDWPYIASTLTALGGALVHPKVRKFIVTIANAVMNPAKVVKRTLIAEAEAQRAQGSADYWEASYKELTDRLDDMGVRLERARDDYDQRITALQYTHKLEIMAIEDDLKEVRVQASRRKEAMSRLSQDREAAILHIGMLEAQILQNKGAVPPRPDWQSAGYDVLMPDSLGP